MTTISLPNEIKECFGGEPYINIGDETCACFIPMSFYLVKLMKKCPLLYAAVVEGVKCAEKGYYAAGILVFSQLIKEFPKTKGEPNERHSVAHEFLKKTPSKEDYESVRKQFNEIAVKRIINEYMHKKDKNKDYKAELISEWDSLIKSYR